MGGLIWWYLLKREQKKPQNIESKTLFLSTLNIPTLIHSDTKIIKSNQSDVTLKIHREYALKKMECIDLEVFWVWSWWVELIWSLNVQSAEEESFTVEVY